MSFTSSYFFIFFAILYSSFLATKSKTNLRNVVLAAASFYFYSYSNWFYTSILIALTVIDYFLAKSIDKETDESWRKRKCLFSILFNLTLLIVFKLTVFRVLLWSAFPQIAEVVGPSAVSNMVIPLGISFYTFESMSYIIDIYRREVKPAKSIIDYALFISFFPHLVAGPIIRAKKFLPQAASPTNVSEEDFWSGINRFFLGCFKKLLLADILGLVVVDHVFKSPNDYSQLELIVAAYAYTFQIYFDFSAYSDMALGLSKSLGFSLPENFDKPFTSTSIKEYWRRWHISLSSWLKDYVYIPLGGNRKGLSRTYLNLFLTMFIGGFWHGQILNFAFFGAYHGGLVVINHFWDKKIKWAPPRVFSILATFHLVVIGLIMFRSENTPKLLDFYSGMLKNSVGTDINKLFLLKTALLILALTVTYLGAKDFKTKIINYLTQRNYFVKIVFVSLSILITLTMNYQFKPFIYFYF